MNRALPNPGTYLAKRNGAIVIEESKEGALLAWIPYTLVAPGVEHIGKHMVVLVQKDGQLSGRNIGTLRKIWPAWDGVDMFALEALDLPAEDCQGEFELADCYHDDSYIPTGQTEPVIQFKAQWLNAIGGTQNMPAPMDEAKKKAVRTKWLSKFKANAGSTGGAAPKAEAKPAATPAAAAPATSGPNPPAKSAGPPSRKAASNATTATPRTMTLEEVWDAFSKANSGMEEADRASKFYAAEAEVLNGRDAEANPLNPQEWGVVADKLGV